MRPRTLAALALAAALCAAPLLSFPLPACCPAPPPGKPVVNSDQTVILLWDPVSKTEHFIRQASFQSQAEDFGFLVPTPTPPELNESGDQAFPFLQRLTEPEKQKVQRPSSGLGCGCGVTHMATGNKAEPAVRVLQEKRVAGFQAAVLDAESARALVGWLKDHGYAFSPEIEAWAKPYVEAGWKITALKVAKTKDDKEKQTVAAAALRLSFKTDRPLFPYREPDPRRDAATLGARHRLLRIYFLADARYQGELTNDHAWTGRVAWADRLSGEQRQQILEMLRLPETTGPAAWWLTEFEDDWPYQVAPADVHFARGPDQLPVKRPPILEYVAAPVPTDVMVFAIMGAVILPPLLRRVRRGRQ
jgi:hypothetical protein